MSLSPLGADPAPRPAKGSRRGAFITGGAGGTALLAFAQTFAEPYKTWVTYASPAVAAVIQASWPGVQSAIVWVLLELGATVLRRWNRRKIDHAIRDLEDLKRDRSLKPDLKAMIEQKLIVLKQARIDVTIQGVRGLIPPEEQTTPGPGIAEGPTTQRPVQAAQP